MQTRKKSARRGLLVSATSLLLSVAMLVGTTFAWFTDSVSSGTNTIKAGNLDIEVKHTNANITSPESIQGKTKLFCNKDGNAMQWEPGAVSYETFTVSNEGTLALKYNLKLNIADYNAVSGTDNTLKDVLKVKVLTGNDMMSDITRDNVGDLGWTGNEDTLDTFSKEGGKLYPAEAGQDKPSNEVFQVVVYWMPTANDNDYNVINGKTTTDGQPLFIDFGINVVATQLEHENDSFGSDYDVGIALPDLPVSINKTFQSAPITTDSVTEDVQVKNVSTSVGVATVPKDAVNRVITLLNTQATDKASTSGTSTVLYLDVSTTEKTETAVTYEINMSATMTYTNTSGETTTKTLDNLDGNLADKIVTAAIEIGKGLANVSVTHHDTPMMQLSSADVNGEGFYYDKATGMLTIKSKSFSPFKVAYSIDAVAVIDSTPYSSLEEAIEAASDDDTISLLKDIITPTTTYYIRNKSITLNLNNKTLSGSGYDGTLCVNSDATLTINGDGQVIGNDDKNYGMAIWVRDEGSKVIINGGDYSNTLAHEDDQMDMIYASNGGDIEINGGTFRCVTPKWTLNIRDADYHNYASTITVKGGKFYQYDPANSNSENPAANFCPEGNGTVQDGDWYEVISGTFAVDETTLKAALANSDVDTIYLSGKIALTDNLIVNRDVTIIGKDSTSISGYPVNVAATADVTFKNVNFATPDNAKHNASSVYASGLEGKVVFDDCTFTNPQWECIQITPMDGAEIVVTDCTFIADGNGTYAQANGTKVERLLHIQNTNASGAYKAVITNNSFVGVDLCRNAVIDVDDIAAFENVTCGGNTFANHDGTAVATLADGMIYVNINGLYDAANVATDTYAQFTQIPASALHH